MTTEQLIIGRALLAGRAPEGVTREDFAEERHQLIWDAITYAEAIGPVNLTTVTMRLVDTRQLDAVGNVGYMLWLGQNTPSLDTLN